MKQIIFLASLIVSSQSFAVRHVGNAGGEAELQLIEMAEYLPQWSKACLENRTLCREVAAVVAETLEITKVPLLNFTDDSLPGPLCKNDQVLLSRELLYVNDNTPKDKNLLLEILLQGLLACKNKKTSRVI